MSAFGHKLRQEREMRGVSLEEISASTKIGTRLLRALEDEQFELLPGGIFNRGFVRAYAKYLGIDQEEAVSDYLEAAGEGDPDIQTIADQAAAPHGTYPELLEAAPRGWTLPLVPVLILAVVALAAAGGWRLYQERQAELSPKQSANRTDAVTNPDVPPGVTAAPANPSSSAGDSSQTSREQRTETDHQVQANRNKGERAAPDNSVARGNSPISPNSAAPPASTSAPGSSSGGTLLASAAPGEMPSNPFEVTVKAKDRAWVSIKSDGKIMVRGIIKPPDMKTIHANEQVVFWTGNAGDVEVSFNGKDVPLSGGQNEERMMVFNSRGLQPNQGAQ